jgi:hypothetical protein
MNDTDDSILAALEELLRNPPAELIRLVRKKCRGKTAGEVKSGLQQSSLAYPSTPIPLPATVATYREVERYCLDLEPAAVRPQLWKPSVQISFLKGWRPFCDVSVFTGGMRVRLKHNADLSVHTLDELESAKPLIRQAFEAA